MCSITEIGKAFLQESSHSIFIEHLWSHQPPPFSPIYFPINSNVCHFPCVWSHREKQHKQQYNFHVVQLEITKSNSHTRVYKHILQLFLYSQNCPNGNTFCSDLLSFCSKILSLTIFPLSIICWSHEKWETICTICLAYALLPQRSSSSIGPTTQSQSLSFLMNWPENTRGMSHVSWNRNFITFPRILTVFERTSHLYKSFIKINHGKLPRKSCKII